MTAYQQIEICLPVNTRTIGRVDDFLLLLRAAIGRDFFHSRRYDPWSLTIARMARRLQMKAPQRSPIGHLPFVGYYTPENGQPQVEEMILLRIAVKADQYQHSLQKLQLLHKKIVMAAPMGLGEEASWIVHHPITRVS